jgi:uncharacterized protein YcfL
MIQHFYFSILAVLLLAGCSSNSQQEQLDLLASNRAQLLNAQLPVEQGPLSILRAIAQKNVIEIMMIYNTDAPDVPSTDQLVKSSITQYCADKSTLANLNAGVVYRIKLRNTRGQLMVDRMVSKDDCASKK